LFAKVRERLLNPRKSAKNEDGLTASARQCPPKFGANWGPAWGPIGTAQIKRPPNGTHGLCTEGDQAPRQGLQGRRWKGTLYPCDTGGRQALEAEVSQQGGGRKEAFAGGLSRNFAQGSARSARRRA
jgi:hypothetical protein